MRAYFSIRSSLLAAGAAVVLLGLGCSGSGGGDADDEALDGEGGGSGDPEGFTSSGEAERHGDSGDTDESGDRDGTGGGSAGSDGPRGSGSEGTGRADGCPASPYAIARSSLDAAFVPPEAAGGRSARLHAVVPVTVDDEGGVYVAFTSRQGQSATGLIVPEGGSPADAIEFPDAAIGGVAATRDGIAALLFDPNPTVNDRLWAAVGRWDHDGNELFRTDLFRSDNLEDQGTRGAPGTSRFAYVHERDELVAYFGHTERARDGVRHQGGYLAAVSAAGEQDLLSGWFGSHNLDQRILVDGADVAVLGLGDAYPKGIFFSLTDRPRTHVVYAAAANGVGATNAQLGGMVALGGEVLVPFITNLSMAQDVDAGTWPDIDDAISAQIRETAEQGTDLGLLRVAKATAAAVADPAWVEVSRGSDLGDEARLESLKSAPYGDSGLILLGWAESTGGTRSRTTAYYTMTVDVEGRICHPKTRLDDGFAFTPGDDFVPRPDGSIVWGNVRDGRVHVVTLTPG